MLIGYRNLCIFYTTKHFCAKSLENSHTYYLSMMRSVKFSKLKLASCFQIQILVYIKFIGVDKRIRLLIFNKLILKTVKSVYKGHSRELENVSFISSCP